MRNICNSLCYRLQRLGLTGAAIIPLCLVEVGLAQRVTNDGTQFLPPDEVRRAFRQSYVPSAKPITDPKQLAPKVQPDPTAGAEARVELNALYEAGEAWREQGLTDKAASFYEKAGAKGHVPSLLQLAEIYSSGGGASAADQEKALKYFAAAARAGDRTALYRLGVMNRDGIGGTANAAGAESYFRRAIGPASRGDAGAAFASAAALVEAGERLDRAEVVRMLKLLQASQAGRAADRSAVLLAAAELNRETGKDLPADFVLPAPEQLRQQAMAELQSAVDEADGASQPDLPKLQYRLASLLESSAAGTGNNGDGRAAALFEAASSAGYLPARFRLERPSARQILDRGGLAETDAQIDDAVASVAPLPSSAPSGPVALIEAAAEAGDAEAQVELGQLFLLGVEREKNPARSFEWFRRASRGGSPEGHYQLGLAYKQGRGTAVNSYNAVEAFRLAAEQGHPDAMYEYGSALGAGRGVKKDTVSADEWLKKASAAGSGAAALDLGKEALRSKADGTRDVSGATRFFLQGARAGNQQSQLEFLKLVFVGSDTREFDMGGSTEQELFSWSTTLANDRSLPEAQRKLATYFLGQCHAKAIGTTRDLTKAAELFAGLTGVVAETATGTSSP